MSTTDLGAHIEQDAGAALSAAASVVRSLPAADLAPGDVQIGADALNAALPAPGCQAVTASIAGDAAGTIVIVLSPELARAIENGPIGPQELVAGLEPALTDATTALAGTYGDLRYEAPQSLDAEIALSNGAAFDSVVVVPVIGGGAMVASFCLLMNHAAEIPPSQTPASFEPLSGVASANGAVRAVELLNDVEMGVTAELGRTRMTVRELLSMQPGSIVELDRAAGSPVDLLVNGTLVARGEVVVIDEEFGVRITEIIGYEQKK